MGRVCVTLLFAIAGCSASHAATDDAARQDDAARHDDASATTDAATSDSGVDTGGPTIDAATTSDVGTDVGADGGTMVAGHVVCGASECAAGEGCLASCLDASDVRTPACLAVMAGGMFPAGACPSGHEMFPRYWLRCDGAEDCATGEACHLVFGSSGQFAWCDTCAAPCDHEFFQVLCRANSECPTDAPHCMPTTDLPGYSTCRP